MLIHNFFKLILTQNKKYFQFEMLIIYLSKNKPLNIIIKFKSCDQNIFIYDQYFIDFIKYMQRLKILQESLLIQQINNY